MREVSLIEVSSPGCHNCAAFRAMWDEEKANWPNVTFKEVSLMSPDARDIIMKHRILASPGIILNDELFSTGPVEETAFLSRLQELSTG